MKKITVCTTCGSPRVTFDAAVDPNNNNEILTIFDNSDCKDCDGECDTEEVEVLNSFDLEEGFWKESMYSPEQLAAEPRAVSAGETVAIGERFSIKGRTFVARKPRSICDGCVGLRMNCEDDLPNCAGKIFEEVK